MEAIKWGRKDVAMMLIGDERYLRKKGLAKANKKSSRQTNDGAIGLYSNEAKTVLIENTTKTKS